jgi:hydrogenase-4 component F
MIGHALCKSAVFFGVGHAAQLKGSQAVAAIGGLTLSHPLLGWGLAIAIAAVAGLPPFVLFASEFLLVTEAAVQQPVLLVLLGLGILTAAAAKIETLQRLCFGDPTPDLGPPRRGLTTLVPLWLHLGLALLLGIALPAPLRAMLELAARIPG